MTTNPEPTTRERMVEALRRLWDDHQTNHPQLGYAFQGVMQLASRLPSPGPCREAHEVTAEMIGAACAMVSHEQRLTMMESAQPIYSAMEHARVAEADGGELLAPTGTGPTVGCSPSKGGEPPLSASTERTEAAVPSFEDDLRQLATTPQARVFAEKLIAAAPEGYWTREAPQLNVSVLRAKVIEAVVVRTTQGLLLRCGGWWYALPIQLPPPPGEPGGETK